VASAAKIKALLQTAIEGDDDRLYMIAMQIAASEARKGHGKFAQELKDIVDQAKLKRGKLKPVDNTIPLFRPKGELGSLLSVKYPENQLSEMVLKAELKERLNDVLREQRQRHKISSYGLMPKSKLLLVGPPGSGKTLTASALAGELKIPLFTIRLDSVITKFMGETASKIRLVFDSIKSNRGVYLFDEFDAIGSKRDSGNDVGEIRRVLNSFLQFLEEDSPNSLIVAATNFPDMLDNALFRRFDDVIRYELPSPKLAINVLKNKLAVLSTKNIKWEEIGKVSTGLSQAELVRAAETAMKSAILANKKTIGTKELKIALEARHVSNP